MGWTSFNMKKPVKDWFKNEYIENKNTHTVLDVALVHRCNLYAANATGQIICYVLLIRWSKGDFNFTYKDMTEFEGPNVCDCPIKILNLLSPLTDENDPSNWARNWRERVINYHKSCNIQDIIKLNTPIKFSNGIEYQYFKKFGRKYMAGGYDKGKFVPHIYIRSFSPARYEYETIKEAA